MEFIELAAKYNEFVQKRPALASEDLVVAASRLLPTLRQAGEYVDEPGERELLAAWSRDVGGTIYKVTGEYPAVRIAPSLTSEHVLPISGMQEVLKESSDNVDEIPQTESIAPSTPEPALIADTGESGTAPEEVLSPEKPEQQQIPGESISAPESAAEPQPAPVEGAPQATPSAVEPAGPGELETAAEEAPAAEQPQEPQWPEEPNAAPESASEPQPAPGEGAPQTVPSGAETVNADEMRTAAQEAPSSEEPQRRQVPEEPIPAPEPSEEPTPATVEEMAQVLPALLAKEAKRRQARKRQAQASLEPAEEIPVPAPTPNPNPQPSPGQEAEAGKYNRKEPVIIGGDQPVRVTIDGPVRLMKEQSGEPVRGGQNLPPAGGTSGGGRNGGTGDGGKGNGSTSGNPLGRIPWVPIITVVAIALLFLLVLILLRNCSLPLQLPGEAAKDLSLVTTSPTPYTDDLYGFTIKYPQLAITSLVAFDTDPTCKGVTFAPETEEHQPDPSAYPRLRVCFVAFDDATPARDIGGQLEARCDHVESRLLTLPVRGFMRSATLGQRHYPARETYIRGQDRDTRDAVKLYEAIVEYDHRFYAIEAADLESNWESSWPAFSSAIDTLQFADNVVIPPDTTLVLP